MQNVLFFSYMIYILIPFAKIVFNTMLKGKQPKVLSIKKGPLTVLQ